MLLIRDSLLSCFFPLYPVIQRDHIMLFRNAGSFRIEISPHPASPPSFYKLSHRPILFMRMLLYRLIHFAASPGPAPLHP